MQPHDDLPLATLEGVRQTIPLFIDEYQSGRWAALYGTRDGKTIGSHLEDELLDFLRERFSNVDDRQDNEEEWLPDLPSINTDVKTTSLKNPQSSFPFHNAAERIRGLPCNLLVFVYVKTDNPLDNTSTMSIENCIFIDRNRTSDYSHTVALRKGIIDDGWNTDDIVSYLLERHLPLDESFLPELAEDLLDNPPEVEGCLTITPALQWRLLYKRSIEMASNEEIDGVYEWSAETEEG